MDSVHPTSFPTALRILKAIVAGQYGPGMREVSCLHIRFVFVLSLVFQVTEYQL